MLNSGALQPEGEQEFSLLTVLRAAANYIILPEQMEQLSPGAREAIIKGLTWAIHEVENAATPPETPAAAMRAAEELKRFSHTYEDGIWCMDERPDGKWVRYSDVAAIITRHLPAPIAGTDDNEGSEERNGSITPQT